MARLFGVARQVNISTGTLAKTVMQLIAASNHRVSLQEVGISFRSTSSTDPEVLVELLRQTTAGTMTSLTCVKADAGRAETLQTTATHTASAEPTAGDIYRSWSVHPQSGLVIPKDLLEDVVVNGGDRIGLRCTTSTGQTADVYMKFEE